MDQPPVDTAADSMLEKVRAFIETLEPEERSMFAALIAPGVAAAWSDDEVEGFGAVWSQNRVQQHLRSAIRQRDLRIGGYDD